MTEYLKLQGRFKHMTESDIRTLQSWLCEKWKAHYGQDVPNPPCAVPVHEEVVAHGGDPLYGI